MTSSLTGAEVNVADADLENDVIPASYGPFRNANRLSMAMWYAEATGSEALFIGAHSDDFSGCPDCRPALLDAFYNAINLVTNPETESEVRHRHGPHSSPSNVQPH